MKSYKMLFAVITFGALIFSLNARAEEAKSKAKTTKEAKSKAKTTEEAKSKAQAKCPTTGSKINKSLYVDHDGKRIYVCCKGCLAPIKKDPAKFIKKLEAEGITLDKTPVALCAKCGESKGSAKCCKAEGRTKCKKCGLLKGSPGCGKKPK